jgi:hypothetical protein
MPYYPIRLPEASVLALAKMGETWNTEEQAALALVTGKLTPDEHAAYMDGRARIAKAAERIVHASTAERRAGATPAADLHELHDEFTFGCLPCAHRQLDLDE